MVTTSELTEAMIQKKMKALRDTAIRVRAKGLKRRLQDAE